MRTIDLFAGCGGLSVGFVQAGFEVVSAVEYDKAIATTYAKNHPGVSVLVDDVRNLDKAFHRGDAQVIIGGPPCQGFSMAGARIRNGFIDDPRNYLFKHYFNIVKTVRPQVFVMENVKGIATMQNGGIFREILNSFGDVKALGGDRYNIFHTVIKASDYGVPQARERMIIIGVLNAEFDGQRAFAQAKERIARQNSGFFDKVSVWEAISNLSGIEPNDTGIIENPRAASDYQRYLASDSEKLGNHMATHHSALARQRMEKICEGENFTKLNENIKSVHSGSYGRLEKDGLAPTVTTRFDTPSGGKFIHPIHNRTITPREAARLQSFPDDYVFCGNKTSVCKQIGNAVPPKCAYFLAQVVREALNDG